MRSIVSAACGLAFAASALTFVTPASAIEAKPALTTASSVVPVQRALCRRVRAVCRGRHPLNPGRYYDCVHDNGCYVVPHR